MTLPPLVAPVHERFLPFCCLQSILCPGTLRNRTGVGGRAPVSSRTKSAPPTPVVGCPSAPPPLPQHEVYDRIRTDRERWRPRTGPFPSTPPAGNRPYCRSPPLGFALGSSLAASSGYGGSPPAPRPPAAVFVAMQPLCQPRTLPRRLSNLSSWGFPLGSLYL
jgi:hypothetical protein